MIDVGNIGKELIQRGWSQGSLLRLNSASKMYLAVENPAMEDIRWHIQQELFSEDDLFIIVSQPCDIQKSSVHEPYVEAMRVFNTIDRKIIHEASRNSVCYFLLKRSRSKNGLEEALIVESTIRLTLDKPSLLYLTPLSNIQDEVVLRLFRRWLTRRYDRPALDDNLVDAVQKPIVKAIEKLRSTHPLQDILDGIGEVLFLLLNNTLPYHVVLLFIQDERSDVSKVNDEQAAELAGWISGVLNKGGNAKLSDWRILSTEQISLKAYTDAYKLPLDQYSLYLDEADDG